MFHKLFIYIFFLLTFFNIQAMPGNYDGSEQNLKALWQFDQSNNNFGEFTDFTGRHKLVTYGNAVISDVSGQIGMGRAITGFSGTGALESTSLGDSDNFTFETWVKWDDLNNLPQNLPTRQVVMANLVGSTFSSILYFANGNLVVEIRSGDGENQIQSLHLPVKNSKIEHWYHIAFSVRTADFDGDLREDDVQVRLYWNDENNVIVNLQPSLVRNFIDFDYRANGWRFRLGKRYTTSNDHFRGTIDEVRLLDKPHNNFLTFQNGDLAFYRGKKAFFLGQSISAGNLPDMSQYGFSLVPRFSSHTKFWNSTDDINTDFPSEENVREEAKKITETNLLHYINIEHLPTRYQDGFTNNIDSIQKMSSIANWIHNEKPGIRIGYYGEMPQREYWGVHGGINDSWMERNELFKHLAQHVDVIFPSLYTFYTDQEGWLRFAEENLKEARKYGKPVYVFLWPVYHNSSDYAGQLVAGDYWRLQLETAYKYADGIVIWSGFGNADWLTVADETNVNNWWYQTLDFIQDKQLNQ